MKTIIIALLFLSSLATFAQRFVYPDGHEWIFTGTVPPPQPPVVGDTVMYSAIFTPSEQIILPAVSNVTIENLSFTGLTVPAILMYECENITIKHCKFSKSAYRAIAAENAKNLIIENCIFDSVADGILINRNAENPFNNGNSSGIKIRHNYFKNIIGGWPGSHAVMISQMNGGGGNEINFNSFEGIPNQSRVDDLININESYGSVNDSIQIIGNWFRGADYTGVNHNGGGITFGDGGGSYAHIKRNIMVNQVGIGNAGANNCIIEDNIVYQSQELAADAACGYIQNNFTQNSDSITGCYANTWKNNKGYCLNNSGQEQSFIAGIFENQTCCNCAVALLYTTNIVDYTLNAAILPAKICIYHY